MNLSQKLTIELISCELFGGNISAGTALIDENVLSEVYSYAVEQDVTYIVASALSKLGLLSGESKAIFFNEQLGSVFRNEQFLHDMEFITSVLENNQIAYIPLKGAIIKQYYPRPEMRTSCDIDVLIHEADLQNALEKLYAAGCVYVSECSHDVMLSTPAGTYLELHFTLNEYEFSADEILKNAWDYASVTCDCRYDFSAEFFIFYHIAHIARHVYTGGCGIRPFVDLKIILDNFEFDNSKLTDLLEKAGLTTFYDTAKRLAKMWFEGYESTELALTLENYILQSGIYGNVENKIAVINEKNGNKAKYIMSIIFPSLKSLKKKYTILNKAPFLLPFVHVYRWFASFFKGSYKGILRIFKTSGNLSDAKQNEIGNLLKSLDLK